MPSEREPAFTRRWTGASQIKVGDLVRLLDGPLAPVPCVSRTAYRPCGDCGEETACAVRAVMQDVREAISGILDNTTLAAMSDRTPVAEQILVYDIFHIDNVHTKIYCPLEWCICWPSKLFMHISGVVYVV